MSTQSVKRRKRNTNFLQRSSGKKSRRSHARRGFPNRMSSVLPSTGNATDSSEDTKIWRPEKTDTSAGSGAPFSRNPPPSTSHCRNSVFACFSVLGIAHPRTLRCAATVGCAAGFSYNGIHRSYRCGGLLRSVSVLWRDRKLDDAQMPKEVTRKTYFRHSAGQSSSLLVSFGKPEVTRKTYWFQKNHPPCTRPSSTSHAYATRYLLITSTDPAHF